MSPKAGMIVSKGYIMEPEAVIQEGPIDRSLLGYQQQHRSHAIWNNNGEPPIYCKTVVVRQNEANLKRLDPPAPPVAELVRQTGFGGPMDIPFISLDLALITALLECWRPETHSLYLGSGEWTVTLQDVEVILGIPVDGLPVVGSTEQDWDKLCEELLGLTLRAKVSRTEGKVELSWLRAHFKGHLEAEHSEEQVRQQARGYILLLIGGMLIPDGSGGSVHLCYLSLLRDLTIRHSWGSACLAGLYHFLCHGSTTNNNDVGGCFILLQLWAWERFRYFAPGRVDKRVRPPDAPLVHSGMMRFICRIWQRMCLERIGISLTCRDWLRALNVASEDNDFLENSAWLPAVHEGYLELPEYTDLATVTNLPNLSRVKLVIALVKSCVRNELGSRLLELKDPTGTFWATLHYKACEEEIFLGIYDVGSCLIPWEIVLFRPTWKSGYLNITLNNVQSVIQKSILD
ncbi:hypothetical protein Vadar_004185 [Vaccinium darrowii]|uniref:Uncharacterized protein n=1 Tax=Vaccinium darrowii TaxID=229202 RepID=A0ACB7ZHE0_9ERIC|nr:hypothetical protein Vadar_004185 [Vaccinium darrowii]